MTLFYVLFEGTDWPPLPPSDYDLLRAQPFAFQRGRRGEAHFVQAKKNFPPSIIYTGMNTNFVPIF